MCLTVTDALCQRGEDRVEGVEASHVNHVLRDGFRGDGPELLLRHAPADTDRQQRDAWVQNQLRIS